MGPPVGGKDGKREGRQSGAAAGDPSGRFLKGKKKVLCVGVHEGIPGINVGRLEWARGISRYIPVLLGGRPYPYSKPGLSG